MEYHIAKTGKDCNEGSYQSPFLSISRAAEIAEAGDRIVVHEGVYREWVSPVNAGNSDLDRITYEAAKGEKVIIKGSEIISNWIPYKENVFSVTLNNELFGSYNPYEQAIEGDWMVEPKKCKVHTGEVYLNGIALYEAASLQDVLNPQKREYFIYPGDQHKEFYKNPEDTLYQWYAEVNKQTTTIYANFQGKNPNEEIVEINVRKSCFFPEKTGVNYITVKGFELAHAATTWAPPTSFQLGIIGPNWSKGWIIEENVIHDSKCSAVCLGKETVTGDELSFKTHKKSGYQYQLEAVFKARQLGWSKDTVGSHIVRNNEIYNCGQNAIVGHMGCIFSKIYGNHIYNIGTKHEFFGWEIAGIKFHAPIDVQIYENLIHDCTLGFWMDWQAQGTRISRNVLFDNDRDGNLEVTHGPMILDNNIFASKYAFDNHSQGAAFVHNLFCGYVCRQRILDRATPYHFPHSTELAGYAFTYGGDERYFNNIFVGNGEEMANGHFWGTAEYDENPDSYEAFINGVQENKEQDQERYIESLQPVYVNGNVYLYGAKAYKKEKSKYVDRNFDCHVEINKERGKIYISFDMPEGIQNISADLIDTRTLGHTILSNAIYDSAEGHIVFDKDYHLEHRKDNICPGPFRNIIPGKNKLCVWN